MFNCYSKKPTQYRIICFISFEDKKVSWQPNPNAQLTQCQLIDRGEAPCVDEPKIVWQNIALSHTGSLKVNTSMEKDHSYLASCSQFDKSKNLVEMSQMQFTYPIPKNAPTVSK